jgi:transposase-like protein
VKNVNAKRGDLCAVRARTTVTLASMKRVERATWELGVVTSVTRDGWVKAYRVASGAERRSTGDHYVDLYVFTAAKMAVPGAELLAKLARLLGEVELRADPGVGLSELKALLAPWRVEGELEAWPNGVGWDVDHHHVIREVDGTFTAALIGLPDGVGAHVVRRRPWLPCSGESPPAEFLRGLVREAFDEPEVEATESPRTSEILKAAAAR